jgi:hypothetical protein
MPKQAHHGAEVRRRTTRAKPAAEKGKAEISRTNGQIPFLVNHLEIYILFREISNAPIDSVRLRNTQSYSAITEKIPDRFSVAASPFPDLVLGLAALLLRMSAASLLLLYGFLFRWWGSWMR